MRKSPCGEAENLAHRVSRRLRFIEQRQAMAMEGLASLGERKASRRAIDETHAEFSLQRGDAAAELRGLQAQRLRRRRVGAEVDHFGKEIEVVEILNRDHAMALIVLLLTSITSISLSGKMIVAQVTLPDLISRRFSMSTTRYLPFVGRLMIGLPFAMSGLGKLAAYGATTAMISAAGLPVPPLAFAVAVAVELGGGLLLVAGYRTRFVAGALRSSRWRRRFRSTATSPTRTR